MMFSVIPNWQGDSTSSWQITTWLKLFMTSSPLGETTGNAVSWAQRPEPAPRCASALSPMPAPALQVSKSAQDTPVLPGSMHCAPMRGQSLCWTGARLREESKDLVAA